MTEQTWRELCIRAEALKRRIATANQTRGPTGIYSTADILNQLQRSIHAIYDQAQHVLLPFVWASGGMLSAASSLCILLGQLPMAWTARFSLLRVLPSLGLTQSSVLEILGFALLLYMALCVYSSLFQLRSMGRYALCGHSNSNAIALLKTALFQCRLQFALAYNFVQLIHEPSITHSLAFHPLWRRMEVARPLGRDLATHAPILMVLVAGCTLGNVYTGLLKQFLGVEVYEQLAFAHVDPEAQVTKGEQLMELAVETIRREYATSATHPEERRKGYKETKWRGDGLIAPPDMTASLLDTGDTH